jgi:uncharacterized protein Usg
MIEQSVRVEKFRLTTAEILYHLPDFPTVLQSYIWQEMDIQPEYPVLNKFLTFWQNELDGPLHSVRVASKGIMCPLDMRYFDCSFTLH